MKALLFSIGTRGDIEPFLAIARVLQEKEWEVICVFPEPYRELVEEMGFAFRGFSSEIMELMEGQNAQLLFGGQGSFFKRMGRLLGMARRSLKLSKESLVLQHRIQVEEAPGLILYHPKCNYSVLWGMTHAGQTILVNPTLDPLTDLGGNPRTFLHRIRVGAVYTMKAAMLKMTSRKFKSEYRGTRLRISSIKKTMLEKEKTLYTLSPSLFTKPLHAPRRTFITGFYDRSSPGSWQPGEELLQFIERHDKIIFITFGSMANPHPGEKTRSILNVLKRHAIPAIIDVAGGGLEAVEEPPGHVFYTGHLPHGWLFPRVHAVVHHGGAGTTHMALKYGCPCLIIPHVLDQFHWEKTVARLKLGPAGISIRKLNERTIDSRLQELYSRSDYKKNAEKISMAMLKESDPEKLYDVITERTGTSHR